MPQFYFFFSVSFLLPISLVFYLHFLKNSLSCHEAYSYQSLPEMIVNGGFLPKKDAILYVTKTVGSRLSDEANVFWLLN